MRFFASAASLLLGVSTFAAAGVRAQDTREVYAVAPLEGLGVDAVLLDKLNGAVRDEMRTLGVAIAAPKPGVSLDCGGDVKCLARAGDGMSATFVLAGSVGLAGDLVHVTLRKIAVVSASEYKAEDGESAADQAERITRMTTMKLVAPDKYVTSGALVLSTPLEGAVLLVDGKERGTAPFFGPVAGLAPGRREVEVRYPGKTSWRGFVDVAFDAPTHLDIVDDNGVLKEVPHAQGPAMTTPTKPAPSVAPAVLAWTGAGLAVVGVAALVGAGAEFGAASSAFERLKTERKQAVVDENRTAAAWYGVLLPLGVVGVVGGAGLAVTAMMVE